MKKVIASFAFLLLAPALAFAVTQNITYTTVAGDTLSSVAASHNLTVAQIVALNPQLLPKGTVLILGTQTVTPPPVVPPTAGEIVIKNGYTTSYGFPDNTPAGTVTHICDATTCAWDKAPAGNAGGTGTYADPITLAVGVSHIGGNEVDDYAKGTMFYDPNLRKYFIAGDICGDGNSPQNSACHTSEIKGTIQLDLWAGGTSANTTKSSDPLTKCEDNVTRTGTIIENPASNYAVVAGAIFNGSCAQQFGDTLVTQ